MKQLGLSLLVFAAVLGASEIAQAEKRFLQEELTHLRSGDRREWSDFPENATGPSLEISFDAVSNDVPATLGLRRVDVKEGWQVKLNDKLLGSLFSDENDMEETWELEAGSLLDGENHLVVEATTDKVDDVRIGAIWLDPRPRSVIFGEAKAKLSAHDQRGNLIPCRFTILSEQGSLAWIGAESSDTLAVRAGVIYTSTGAAEIGLAPGNYRVMCGRGFEYSIDETSFRVESNDELSRQLQLRRVVDTAGLVACDTHVHTFEISRHGDASLTERMVTLAGEGVELVIATDHNVFVDYRPHLKRLGLTHLMTPVIGNEVTTKNGHFNVFPAIAGAELPDHRTEDWQELLEDIYSTPDVRVAILNHARDVHSGYTPFGPENMIGIVGERTDNRVLEANAMEVINSAALQSDPMVLFHDWMTQLNRGIPITPIGSSDSHEVSRKIVGQGRTYVRVDDSEPGSIDVDAATDSFVAGRVRVSMGLLTELTVNDHESGETATTTGDQIEVKIVVRGPDWVSADRVHLYSNGQLLRSEMIAETSRNAAGEKGTFLWQIDRPEHDVHLVALATGPGVSSLHWPIAKPYQPASPRWVSYVFGCSGAVRVDADSDGEWTSAKEYAQRAVTSAGESFAQLLDELSPYDVATVAFAAHVWLDAGRSIESDEQQAELRAASETVRKGFRRYLESQRESLTAMR